MNASAAIADSLLRQAWPLPFGAQAGGLATQSVNVLQGGRLPPSRLHAPVSPRDCRVPVGLPLQRVERDEPS